MGGSKEINDMNSLNKILMIISIVLMAFLYVACIRPAYTDTERPTQEQLDEYKELEESRKGGSEPAEDQQTEDQ